MPESLVHRVRGEQIPAGKNHLRLLEVVVDEDQRPFWRARCLQSGHLLNVALDYVGERRRAQKRRRWIFLIGSLLLAAIAMHYQDTIMALLQKLQDIIRAGRVSI